MNEEKISRIFVYGTLKVGQVRYSAVEHYVVNVDTAILHNAKIIDLGPFPAMVECDNGSYVIGELMEVNNIKEVLRQCDAIEGYKKGRKDNLYNRKVVTINEKKAYTYFFSRVNHISLEEKPVVEEWKGENNDNA